jgi:hypothetical protein
VTTEQAWLAATGALVIGLALVAVVVAVRAQRRAARAEGLVASLAERVAVIEERGTDVRPPAATDAGPSTYVITQLDGPERADVPVARDIDGRLFADIVARETVVKAASWTHGLRRALSPENRNRIRFEVRQEVRRTGRARRAETKQALREYRARERAASAGDRVEAGEDVA